MKKIIAALDNSAAARPVLAAAAALAGLYDATVEAVHVRENGDRTARAAAEAAGLELRTITGPVVKGLLRAARAEEVAAIVVGASAVPASRRPAGHTALEVIISLRKPVVVVPPHVPTRIELRRILVPLDGTKEAADALASVIRLARGSEIEVVILHVHDQTSLPLFDEQLQHETEAWMEEFLARYCPCPPDEVELKLRVGLPGEHVLQVAAEVEADLIALSWAQVLAPDRAAVVREALQRSTIPVLLVPVVQRTGPAARQPAWRGVPASG